jgi:hypothetical protein
MRTRKSKALLLPGMTAAMVGELLSVHALRAVAVHLPRLA